MNEDTPRSSSRRSPAHQRPPAPPAARGALSGDEAAITRLARSFSREPELILACLETEEADSPQMKVVFAAAQRAMAEHPGYADLRYAAAQAAVRLDQLAVARGWLDRALEVNPRYRDALILAARVASAEDRNDEALLLLQEAVACGANYADVYVMLGDTWRKLDDVAKARNAYQRALEINAGLASARNGLAACVDPE